MNFSDMKLGDKIIVTAKMVKNPNPNGKKDLVDELYAKKWLREHGQGGNDQPKEKPKSKSENKKAQEEALGKDFSKVDVETLTKNMNVNLNHYDNKEIKVGKVEKHEPLTKKNSEAHLKAIATNAVSTFKKYESAISSPISKKLVHNHIKTMTSCIEEGIADGSLKCHADDLDAMMQDSIKALVHQEIETRSRALGDHGVRHVLSNANNTHKMLDELKKSGIKVSGADKFAASVAQIQHDMGYTVGAAAYDVMQTKHHKAQSGQLFDEQKEKYGKIFGEETTAKISNWIKTHDDNNFQWESDPVGSSIRMADSMALFAEDKVPELFLTSGNATAIMGKMLLANQLGLKTDKYLKALKKEVDSMKGLTKKQKEELKNSVDEIDPSFSTSDLLSRYSGRLKGFKYDKKAGVMDVSMSYTAESDVIQKLFSVGQRQFEKLNKDFTEFDKDGKPKGFSERTKDGGTLYKDASGKPTFRVKVSGRDTALNNTANKQLKDLNKHSLRSTINDITSILAMPPEVTSDLIKSAKKRQLSAYMTDQEKSKFSKHLDKTIDKLREAGLNKESDKWSKEDHETYKAIMKEFKKFPPTKMEKAYLGV